jgi:SAM-dependent methyltransferase
MMQEAMSMHKADWNRAWREMRTGRPSPARHAKFWDGRSRSFAKHVNRTCYAENFLKIMAPQPQWTVLDMGCGAGTLALPLADKVQSVTAVDFSEKMLAILREECLCRNISNIEMIHASWEDDWAAAGIGQYDVAIASRSLVVDDLKGMIAKLNHAARKRVFIVTVVGDGPHDRQAYEAVGRELQVGPDYIYNYNVLYQVGIYAKVDFIVQEVRDSYADREGAVDSVRWMFPEMAREEDEKLDAYLAKHLICRDDQWMLDYAKTVRWAVLWWEKE